MPAEDVVVVDVDLDDVYDYPDLDSVGSVYQIAINGVGYMLADTPDQPAYRKQVVPLDPARLATTDTPFSEAVERYNFATLSDGTAGAGQRWLNRALSTGSGFYDSEGVDPFTVPGEISLVPATVEEIDSTYATLDIAVVGRALYALTGTNELTYVTTPGGTETAVTVAAASTFTDITSDGQYWYACDGASVWRGTTSDPGSHWSNHNVKGIVWAGGRICAAEVASGSTPNRFTTFNDSGTEERGSGHITFPEGSTINLGGETQGHVYFGLESGNVGSVWAWPMGLTDTGTQKYPFEALELPTGMVPTAVGVGGGFVWVRAHQPEGTGKGRTVLFQCAPDQTGALIATLVAELAPVGTAVDHSVGGFATNGNFMYFGWKGMANSNAGVGAVYLPTGGYAKWFEAGGDGDVATVDVWQGMPVMAVRGQGVYRASSTTYVTTSNITTSIADGASALDKVWDDVSIVHDPLPTGGAVEVQYSLDNGGSWTSLGSSSTAGTKTKVFGLAKAAKTLSLKAIITLGSGTTAPQISTLQARYHAIGLADEQVQLTIDCGDNLKGLNGHPLPENGNGAGATRAHVLQHLVQERVKFQDIDWHLIGHGGVYDCESIDIGATIMYDPQTSGQRVRMLATITLRAGKS